MRGQVRVNGALRPKSHRVAAGDVLEIVLDSRPETTLEHEQAELALAYEDEYLLVVDKPSGLVVHPGAGRAEGTLAHALVGLAAGGEDPDRPGIVHRLDRETSGLLVVARTEEAYRGLAGIVRRRALERGYVALVRGRPRSRTGRIEAPIGRDRVDPTRRSLDTEAPRAAVTHFALTEPLGDYALLDVRLETGRTHQIRVHLAAIELPIVGDRTYGVQGLGLTRQFLHAGSLAFPHPVTGERIEAVSPLPKDLAAALEVARGR